MIASYELDVADALKGHGDSVAVVMGDVESLDQGALSCLIDATATIGSETASEAGLMPMPAPSEQHEAQSATASMMAIEDGKPDLDEAATATLPTPDERSMGSISAPVETEATDGDAASLVDAPDFASELDATHEPVELAPPPPPPDGNIDAGAAESEIAFANAKLPPADVDTMTKTEGEVLIPSHSENEARAAVVEDDDVVPAAQADEPDAEPVTSALPESAAEDAVGIDKVAPSGATGTDSEIASTAPAWTETEVSLPEVTAPSLSHDEGAPNTMVQAPEESVVPPAEAPPMPDESPAPAIKDSTPRSASTVILPAVQVPEENPAYAMAVKFAERGIAVFPLFGFNGSDCSCGQPADAPKHKPGKHPRQLASFKGASTNLATIKSWFTYFGPVNYGIAAGQQVGTTGKVLVIVDIDWYKPEGQQSVDDLIQAGFLFPDTAEVLTGGGGRHLYYLADADAKFERKLGVGIDFQTLGYYVVGPGSMHKSGKRYDWEASSDFFHGQEIADLPQWVYEKFGKPHVTEAFAAPLGTSLAPSVDELTDAEIAAYKEDLEMISPLGYDTWVEVLMALKSRSESEQMFAVADWWSQKAGYKGVEAVRATWKSIKAQGGITIKTLKRLADAVRHKDVDISRLLIEPAAKPTDDSVAWLQPTPIHFGGEAVAYPLDALPELLKSAVVEVQAFTKAPIAMVACSAISTLSLAAQALYDVQRAEGLSGPIGVFMLTVANSGERKTTLDGMFSAPIQQYEARCATEAKTSISEYTADLSAWEAKRKGILDRITRSVGEKNAPTSNAELRVHEITQPLRPLVPRLIYGDVTPEALKNNLAVEWPSGGIISSEGGAVFGGHGMKKDNQMGNMATLNELWDGKPGRTDRRTTQAAILKSARLTVAIQVQEPTLKAFLGASNALARGTGFLARFLIAWPTTTMGTRSFTEPPTAWPMRDRFHQRITQILHSPQPIVDRELKPNTLTLTTGAKAAWVAFHDEIEAQLGLTGDYHAVCDVASKAADNAVRIGALFHVLEGETDAMSESHMRSANRIARWHLNEAQRLYGDFTVPQELVAAAKLNDWLVAHCKKMQVQKIGFTELMQLGPNGLRKKAMLEPPLEQLVGLGRVRFSVGPARTVYLNPALLN